MSSPSKPTYSKRFESQTGNVKLSIESTFTYNSIYRIENFTLLLYNKFKNISFPFQYLENSLVSQYRNISGLHNRIDFGTVEFSVSAVWMNVSIFSELVMSQNGIRFVYNSSFSIIDYATLLNGIITFINLNELIDLFHFLFKLRIILLEISKIII